MKRALSALGKDRQDRQDDSEQRAAMEAQEKKDAAQASRKRAQEAIDAKRRKFLALWKKEGLTSADGRTFSPLRRDGTPPHRSCLLP